MPFNSTNKPIVPNINEDNFTQFIPEPTMAVYDDPMPQPEDTSKYGFGYEIKQDLASIPESNSFLGKAYRINFYTPQDWHNDALKYAQKLNMNPDVLMNAGMGAIEQARAVSNQIDRRQAAGMYQDMPELETIRYGSTAEALDALQHVASVNSTRGIWDSIQQNVWSINDQMKLGEAGYELAETDDPDKKKSLLAEINRLQNNLQQYRTESNSLAESLVGGTIGQVAMMGSQALKGLNRAAEGAAIGAGMGAASGSLAGGVGAVPGAIAGFIAGGSVGAQTGMAEQMYRMSMGNKYIEYMQKKDSDGNNIYTPSEAKAYAMSFGAVDTAIEFAALRGMGRAISAAKPATSAIGDIVGGVTKEATLDTGIGTSVARAFKAGIKTSLAETSEEGLQDVDEKLQHNLFRKDNDPEGVYSLSDIGEGAIGAMWQALPSVVGLGALGGLAGGIRSANAFRQWHNMTPEERELMVHQQQNAVGNQIVRELAEDSKAQELNNNNPELYQKIVQAQGERAGISHAYINANELVDTEEGQQVINRLVDSGIVTAKDVEESIANDAPMEMPIGKFAQVAQDFDEPIKQAIEKVTFYNKAGISQEGIKRAVETANIMRERMADNQEEQKQKLANDIVSSKFSDLTPEQQDTVKAVFSDNPYDVKGSYARLYNSLNESYREDYNADYQTLHAENQDANNRPNWYSDYVNNNGKAPDITAMRRIAYEEGRKRSTDIVDKALPSVGTENNDSNTAVKTSLNAGLALAKKSNNAKNNAKNGLNKSVNNLENLTKVSDNTGVNNYYDEMVRRLNELETLDAMRERIYKVADSDIFLRDGISKEALDVYNDIKGIFKQSDNLAVKKQAEHGALLFASHADAMANIMRQAGRTEFTAMDYYKQYVNIQTGGNYNGAGFTQEESKIETPAFKKWFAKSKVVDEQGNPIVLYHGGVNNTWSIYGGEKKSKESYNTYANSNSIYLTNNKNIAETYMPNVVVSNDNLDEHKNNINNLQFPSTSRLFYETAFYPTIANKKKGVKPVDVTVVLKPSNTNIDVDFIKIKGVEGKFSADEAIKQIKSMGGKITLKHNFTGIRDLYYNEDYNHNLKNLKHTSIFTGTDLISAKTLADKIFGIKKSIYTFNTRIGSVRAFYAKIENPFVVDLMGQNGNFDGIKDSKGKRWGYTNNDGKTTALQAIEEYARNSDKKYDGVIVKNVEDIGSDTNKDTNGNIYIVFSNKNIKSINNNGNFDANNPNIYAQKAIKNVRGTTAITADNKKLVELFNAANFSTFVHESGHVFLEDLRMLANMEGAPKQVIEDWQAVKSWTGYIEGADVDTNRNAHEKFAKGFEAYVRTGNAPTKVLQRAFRQFKQWLVSLYRSVRQLGGNPPKEIRNVMDRMLAIQKDIDAWAGERELEAFENTKLFTALNEEDKASINDLVASIKEKAKEKVMNTYEKEVREHPLESFNANKLEIQLNIEAKLAEQYPIYKIRQNIEILGEQSALADTPYKTINELEDAEKREGIGIWSDAVKDEMKKAKGEYLNPDITDEDIKQMAENYINSSNGQLKLTIAESNAIQRMTDREIAKNWSTISKLDKLDLDAEDIREQMAKLAEDDTNVDIADEGVQTKEVKEALKAERQQNIKNLRALRDLHINSAQELRQQAIEALNSTKIGMATSFKTHQRQAIVQARAADNAMARGRMTEAFRHKQKQLLHQSIAVVAYENDVLVRKINNRLKANLVRMTRPKKPIMVNPDARYYINKIMYNLGMTHQEAIEPINGFNMDTINKMLDPDADLLGEESQAQIDGIFQMAFEGKNTNWRNFTLSEFKSLDQLLQGLYTAGKRQYMGTTILDDHGNHISFEKASSEMCEQLYKRFRQKGDLLNENNAETWTSKGLGTVGSYILDLTKTEVMLKRFDDNKDMGVWWRYVYRPIDTATKKGKVMLEKATRELADTCRTYTNKEMWAIRNERAYTIGNIHNLTKEQVITAALNWGTETNRQRVIDTFNAESPIIEKAFAQYLDDKDWEFIIKTWAQINQYFNERSSVQERLYGTPMKKEKGITFSIGNRKIEGQYYPIVYDPKLDSAAKDYAVEDIVRSQLSSNAVWGSGMSATKQRSNIVKGKKLLLSFDVIPRAVEEAVNHVAMREACTDVNRLLADRNVQEAIVNTVGVEVYQSMKNWVRDNWQLEIARMGTADKMINAFKKNAVTATMAYRVSTALLNVLNVISAIHKVGLLPTIRSLCTFYSPGNYKENRQRVMNLSVFMRERINNLDRDLQKGLTIGGKSYDFTGDGLKQSISKGKFVSKQVADKVNAYGYLAITEADFMLSLPIWAQEYDRKRAELIKQGHEDPLFVQQEAVSSADRVVREIWGSGDTKDSPSMMRRKHGWAQLFTPFYTYSNTVLNALVSAGYEGLDKKKWGALISAMFYWVIAQGMAEGLLRSLWDNNDDDDIETLIPKMGKEVLGNTVQGFPIVRDAFSAVTSALFGESFTGRSTNVVAMSGIDKLQQTIKEAKGGNWIDAARSATEVGNRLVGFSDTITDAFWTLIKWGLTDVNTTTQDVAKAMLFDKKLKDARDIAKQKQAQKNKLNNQRKKKDGER